MESLRLHRIERRGLASVELGEVRTLREGVVLGKERKVEKRKMGDGRRREDEVAEVDRLLRFGADPTVRDGPYAETLRRTRHGDRELKVDRFRVRTDQYAGELKNRQVVFVFDPDPERLESPVVLLGPLERFPDFESDSKKVVRQRLQRGVDLESR